MLKNVCLLLVPYRECFQEYETLYDALHGVAGETKRTGQVTPLSADDGAEARLNTGVLRS